MKRKPVLQQYEHKYGPIWGRKVLSFKNRVARWAQIDRRVYRALRALYDLFMQLLAQHLASISLLPIEEA
jgi:hypothetical protein